MDFSDALLYVFCGIALAGALGLVVARHPIHGAINLLGTMLALAGVYALLNAHLIAALQVIIYAGAIMILVVYIIMLLDLTSEEAQQVLRKTGVYGLPLVLALGAFAMPSLLDIGEGKGLHDGVVACAPGEACEQSCEDNKDGDGDGLTDCADPDCEGQSRCFGTVESVGANLLGPYVLPFEVSSILLLSGIVGAILLTGPRPRRPRPGSGGGV